MGQDNLATQYHQRIHTREGYEGESKHTMPRHDSLEHYRYDRQLPNGQSGVREQLGLGTNVSQADYDKALRSSGKTEAEILKIRQDEQKGLDQEAQAQLKDLKDPNGKPYDMRDVARRAEGWLDT